MKRFNRLRRAARKMAAEKGHELGVFQNCPMEFSLPGRRITVRGKMYDGAVWLWARCIKCDEAVYISETLDPHPDDKGNFHGTNPMDPFFEIKAIRKTNLLQKEQEAAGLKGDFPKRSLGVISGETVLSQDCRGYPAQK